MAISGALLSCLVSYLTLANADELEYEWRDVVSSDIVETVAFGVNAVTSVDANGRLVVQGTVKSSNLGCGGAQAHIAVLFDDAPVTPWERIRYTLAFAGSASCWSILGNTVRGDWDASGISTLGFGDNAYIADSLDIIENELKRGSWAGEPTKCDNVDANFFTANNGYGKGDKGYIRVEQDRDLTVAVAGLGAGFGCTSSGSKATFSDIQIGTLLNPPTSKPTKEPTKEPTSDPTADPTTRDPTSDPTADPTTRDPTSDPTADPTTKEPTRDPTADPTADPTRDPTADPTRDPTSDPTRDPTQDPTLSPTLDGCDLDIEAYLSECYCESTMARFNLDSAQSNQEQQQADALITESTSAAAASSTSEFGWDFLIILMIIIIAQNALLIVLKCHALRAKKRLPSILSMGNSNSNSMEMVTASPSE